VSSARPGIDATSIAIPSSRAHAAAVIRQAP
jgi:hypothetical protein